ncbi:MAG: hypothetical protein AAF311_13390 [Pseudomonadota bacterium]
MSGASDPLTWADDLGLALEEVSLWPRHPKDVSRRRIADGPRVDPRSKPGPIGAWNRVFDPGQAIAEFELPYDLKERGPTEDRYNYEGTDSGPGGIHNKRDGMFISFHGSDPLRRVTDKPVNSFDLVRIHLFGELDEGMPDDAPIRMLPSQKAMLDFARANEEVADAMQAEADAEIDRYVAMLDEEDEA